MVETLRHPEPAPTEPADATTVLTWQVHLLKEDPGRLGVIIPVALISLAICYLFFGSVIPMVAVLFLFTSSLSDYLFPIIYRVDSHGASARTPLSKASVEWGKVKKCYLNDMGVKLSTLGRPSRLEPYRGVFLRFADNREELIKAVKELRDAARPDAGPN